MMSEASNEQIAALRERIRRAGTQTRWVRRLVLLLLLLTVGGLLALGITELLDYHRFQVEIVEPTSTILNHQADWDDSTRTWTTPPARGFWPWLVTVTSLRFLGLGLVSLLLAAFTAAVYRWRWRAGFHRELCALSPSDAAQVLQPLHLDSQGDTRKIVLGLNRRLKLPGDL